MKAVKGEESILPSEGVIDWLGTGAYFWEGDYLRALEWAKEKCARGDYEEPFVIGAAIDLGNCLDLMVRENLELAKIAYDSLVKVFEKSGEPLPQNSKAPKDASPDLVLRRLDCAVINHLHEIVENGDGTMPANPFDTVRGLFQEGKPIYKDGGLLDKTHSQIAVRNAACIKGVFLPPELIV